MDVILHSGGSHTCGGHQSIACHCNTEKRGLNHPWHISRPASLAQALSGWLGAARGLRCWGVSSLKDTRGGLYATKRHCGPHKDKKKQADEVTNYISKGLPRTTTVSSMKPSQKHKNAACPAGFCRRQLQDPCVSMSCFRALTSARSGMPAGGLPQNPRCRKTYIVVQHVLSSLQIHCKCFDEHE